jgi:hypothetical protein
VATWEDVRRLSLALPDAEESTHYGEPAFKVKGRAFVNTCRVAGAVMLRCSDDEAEFLIRARPDVYFLTPHFVGWGVLLRLDAADEEELAGALEDSYARQRDRPPLRRRKR